MLFNKNYKNIRKVLSLLKRTTVSKLVTVHGFTVSNFIITGKCKMYQTAGVNESEKNSRSTSGSNINILANSFPFKAGRRVK